MGNTKVRAIPVVLLLALALKTQAQQQHFNQQQLQQMREMLDSEVQSQQTWTMSPFDVEQNIKIKEQDIHLEKTDTRVKELTDVVTAMGRAQSDMEGADRVWFAILFLIVSGVFGYVAWNKKGKKKEEE